MATFTYTNPTVGGSEDTWGATLNANWTALGAFFGDLDSTEIAVLDGITASTAELNLLTGVTVTLADITATASELNLLDGVTASTAEINYLSGVTSAIQGQIDGKAPDNELTQIEVEDDTSTVFGQVSGQRLAQATAATSFGSVGAYGLFQTASAYSSGDTASGSVLYPSGANAYFKETGTVMSGTWRCMGHSEAGFAGSDVTVWKRIA